MSEQDQVERLHEIIKESRRLQDRQAQLLEEAESRLLDLGCPGDGKFEEPDEVDLDDQGVPKDLRIAYGTWPAPAAEIVGDPNEPRVHEALERLEDYLLTPDYIAGVGWSAAELCRLPRAPGRPVAVPPRGLWHHMLPTLELYEVIRERLAEPCSLRAYRPPDYNAGVGGAKRSSHIYFAAIDIYAPVHRRRDLALIAAEIWRDAEVKSLGLGIYGYPYSSNIHIDVLAGGRRKWADTDRWIKEKG